MNTESATFEEKHNKIGSRLSLYHLDSEILKKNLIYLNWHRELELILVERGRLGLYIGGKEYLVEEGEIAVVNMGRLHSGTALDGKRCVLWVFLIDLDEKMICNNSLEGQFLWPLLLKQKEILPVLARGTVGCQCVGECLRRICTELKPGNADPVYELKAISGIYDLLFCLFTVEGLVIPAESNRKTVRVERKNDIRVVLQYMEDHYAQRIYVEQLADLLYMGVDNFYKFFFAETGTSPISFLNILRSKKAAALLRQTALPVSQISDLVGFHSVSYFSKVFKRIYDMTPSRYRKEERLFQEKK